MANKTQCHPTIIKQKGLENVILLMIGASKEPISHLHLQKEIYLLCNFIPDLRDEIEFEKYYTGPHSSKITESISYPFFLDGCWNYKISNKKSDLSGGYINITKCGEEKYKQLYQKAIKHNDFSALLSGIKMVRELYDKLSAEELILLFCDTYPEYVLESSISKAVLNKSSRLAKKLYDKNLITLGRYNELTHKSMPEHHPAFRW